MSSMSSPIVPYVVRDSKIADISDVLDYQVRVGASSKTYVKVPSLTVSNSNISFSANPSEGVALARDMTISATIAYRLVISGTAATHVMFNLGVSDALAQLPLNQAIQTATVNINGSSQSVQTQNIHAILANMTDDSTWIGDSPKQRDARYRDYSSMLANVGGSPFLSYAEYNGQGVPGRGSFALDSFAIARAGTGTDAGDVATHLSAPADIVHACTASHADNVLTVNLVYTVREPLAWVSPLIYAKTSNNAALTGVRNLDIQLSLDSSGKRSFSYGGPCANVVSSITGITNALLHLEYLTADNLSIIGAKSVVGLTQYGTYITTNQGVVAAGATNTVTSQMVTLNQIPSKIYVAVRRTLGQTTVKDSNCFFPISKVSVNFNNRSNQLASMDAGDLYEMSARNGLKLNREEFVGYASAPQGKKVATIGSVLVISPPDDFCLGSTGLANGSAGNFQYQMDITYKNTGADANPEIVIIAETNGVFICEAGSSSTQTALLDSRTVVDALTAQDGESSMYVKQFERSVMDQSPSGMKNIPLMNRDSVKKGGVKTGGSYAGAGRVGGRYY